MTPPATPGSAKKAAAAVTRPATPKPPAARPAAKKIQLSPWMHFKKFFTVDPVRLDMVASEDGERRRFQKRLGLVVVNAFVIMGLGLFLILGIPFFTPVYRYYAVNPQRQVLQLVALNMPNMTNGAILSWATTSITEVMTMGFGDYENHLKSQRFRFEDVGWDTFASTFDKLKIGEKFRQSQLVLTTVPSNTPVITSQGINPDHVYQWVVQLPVIMTYATNNEKTRIEQHVIELTIVRASPGRYPSGVAIKNWTKAS